MDKGSHIKLIQTYAYKKDDMMKHAQNICINSYKRSVELFEPDNPSIYDNDKLFSMTREIFADAIGNLISIWVSIWIDKKDDDD